MPSKLSGAITSMLPQCTPFAAPSANYAARSGRMVGQHVGNIGDNDFAALPSRQNRMLTMQRKIEWTHVLHLAVNDFLAGGGDGYDVLIKAHRIVDLRTSELLVRHLADYLSQAGTIGTAGAPRLHLVSEASTP